LGSQWWTKKREQDRKSFTKGDILRKSGTVGEEARSDWSKPCIWASRKQKRDVLSKSFVIGRAAIGLETIFEGLGPTVKRLPSNQWASGYGRDR